MPFPCQCRESAVSTRKGFLKISKGWKHVLCRKVKQFSYLDWRRPKTGLITAFKCLLSCHALAVHTSVLHATMKRGNGRKTWLDVKTFLKTRLINPDYQRRSKRTALRSFQSQRKRGLFGAIRALLISPDQGSFPTLVQDLG